MRILTVSDVESKYFYDYYTPGKLKGYDLILACGDLKREYLEFLVTAANCTLLYVRGNHDDRLEEDPPEGCICIDGKLYVHKDIRILGLGGSYRYRQGNNLYTEHKMRQRILRLMPTVWLHHGFDILMTHAPARGMGDLDDLPHRGFECFAKLLDKYRPAYFIHGHVHLNYGVSIPHRSLHGDTVIINAYDHYEFDYEA